MVKTIKNWSIEQGLDPSETVYLKWGKGFKHNLRFSKSGKPHIEKAYRTHYVLPNNPPRTENEKTIEEKKRLCRLKCQVPSSSIDI